MGRHVAVGDYLIVRVENPNANPTGLVLPEAVKKAELDNSGVVASMGHTAVTNLGCELVDSKVTFNSQMIRHAWGDMDKDSELFFVLPSVAIMAVVQDA